MSDSLPSEKLLDSLFASLLSFTLSNKRQSKICYRENPDHIDKICLKLGAFEKFANAVLQTLAIHANKCVLSCDYFFQSCETAWKESHFERLVGSIVWGYQKGVGVCNHATDMYSKLHFP